MAIERLDKTLDPPDPQAAMRYVKFDAIRMVVDRDLFDNTLIRLAGQGKHPSGLFYLPGDQIGTVPKGTVLKATEVAPVRTLFGDYQWLKVELTDPADSNEKKAGWVYLGKKDAEMTLKASPRKEE
ncbi:MAG: hypothetical protein AB1714_00795 [Acidobacteriota bacterium]